MSISDAFSLPPENCEKILSLNSYICFRPIIVSSNIDLSDLERNTLTTRERCAELEATNRTLARAMQRYESAAAPNADAEREEREQELRYDECGVGDLRILPRFKNYTLTVRAKVSGERISR